MARRAATPSQMVNVHYRKLDRETRSFPQDISFAEALRRGLQARVGGNALRDDVRERVQDAVPNKPGEIRCWNNIHAARGAVFGTLCLYRPSELQAVILARGMEGRLNAFPVDQIGEAAGRDFLRAIAYWMAVEDHFYLIQSPSLQTGAMEDYFQWLLQKAEVLSEDQGIKFNVAFDRDAVGGDLEDLQSINIGGTFEAREPVMAAGEPRVPQFREGPVELAADHQEVVRQRVGRKPVLANAWDILHQVVMDERSLDEIADAYRNLRQEDPKATLDAELEFFVRTRRQDEGGASRQAGGSKGYR